MNIQLNRNRMREGCGSYCVFLIIIIGILFGFFQWVLPCLKNIFLGPPPPPPPGQTNVFNPTVSNSVAVQHFDDVMLNGNYEDARETVGISYIVTSNGPQVTAIWMVPRDTNANFWQALNRQVDTSPIDNGLEHTVNNGGVLSFDEFGNPIVAEKQTCTVCVERKGAVWVDEYGNDPLADDGWEPMMAEWEPVIITPVVMGMTNVVIDGLAYPNKAFYRVRVIP